MSPAVGPVSRRPARVASVTAGAGPPGGPQGRHGAPRVTIGIPTFNRAATLERAVESCRAQSYPNLEIVISDNASTDGTAELCAHWRRADPAVRVIRQLRNIGRDPNFAAVLRAASGELFMWLSDDDWLDPTYVAACARELIANPAYAMVGGVARYVDAAGAELLVEGAPPLDHDDAGDRVLAYLRTVNLNGTYYGLMRREQVFLAEYPMTLAGDWYFVAQVAAQGPIVTLADVAVHRSLVGSSSDMRRLASSFGVAGHWGEDIHLWALALFAPAILAGRGTFARFGAASRVRLALGLGAALGGRWWRHAMLGHVIAVLGPVRRRTNPAVRRRR